MEKTSEPKILNFNSPVQKHITKFSNFDFFVNNICTSKFFKRLEGVPATHIRICVILTFEYFLCFFKCYFSLWIRE